MIFAISRLAAVCKYTIISRKHAHDMLIVKGCAILCIHVKPSGGVHVVAAVSRFQ